jgi:MFS family permease
MTYSREFRLLAAGQALSWLGTGFQTVALAVAVVGNGGSAGDLGLVLACNTIALLFFTLFGGVWADRVQPQRAMALADIVRFVTVGGIAWMFWTGHRSLLLLCVLVAAGSAAGSLFQPAMTALKPMLVSVEQRQSANATLSILKTGCSMLGPVAGGLVVAAFGAPLGFAINAVSFLASVATVLLIRTRVQRTAREGMLAELRSGWREVRSRDWLLSGVLAATLYHIANGAALVLVQVVALRDLGGASSLGFIAAAEGLGGVIGAALALRWMPRRLLVGGWLALMTMPLWLLAYVWPGVLAAVLAGAVLGYAGLFYFDVAWETAIQDHVPHRVLARVASWDIVTSFAAMPIGSALAGPLASAFGIRPVLAGCAVVLFAAAVVPLLVDGTRTIVRLTNTGEAPEVVHEPPEAALTSS